MKSHNILNHSVKMTIMNSVHTCIASKGTKKISTKFYHSKFLMCWIVPKNWKITRTKLLDSWHLLVINVACLSYNWDQSLPEVFNDVGTCLLRHTSPFVDWQIVPGHLRAWTLTLRPHCWFSMELSSGLCWLFQRQCCHQCWDLYRHKRAFRSFKSAEPVAMQRWGLFQKIWLDRGKSMVNRENSMIVNSWLCKII